MLENVCGQLHRLLVIVGLLAYLSLNCKNPYYENKDIKSVHAYRNASGIGHYWSISIGRTA